MFTKYTANVQDELKAAKFGNLKMFTQEIIKIKWFKGCTNVFKKHQGSQRT